MSAEVEVASAVSSAADKLAAVVTHDAEDERPNSGTLRAELALTEN